MFWYLKTILWWRIFGGLLYRLLKDATEPIVRRLWIYGNTHLWYGFGCIHIICYHARQTWPFGRLWKWQCVPYKRWFVIILTCVGYYSSQIHQNITIQSTILILNKNPFKNRFVRLRFGKDLHTLSSEKAFFNCLAKSYRSNILVPDQIFVQKISRTNILYDADQTLRSESDNLT